MGFFAAVMFGAILSSFNSVLNSVNTMFTMDIYHEYINPKASEEKLVDVGKKIGIVFAVATTIVGPMVYFFPAGLKTFLDSFVMLIGLPVLSAVFGGFFFKYLPKYAAKVIMVFHVVVYGLFMLLAPSYPGGGTMHYLYAVAVLWPIELIIMAIMNKRNKKCASGHAGMGTEGCAGSRFDTVEVSQDCLDCYIDLCCRCVHLLLPSGNWRGISAELLR